MIYSFPKKQTYNHGGYTAFMFAAKQDISVFPMAVNGVAVSPLSFYSGKAWLQGYATADTLNYTEETQADAHGDYYVKTITGFVPGEKSELIALMSSMRHHTFIVVVKDRFGKQRLVGTPAAPLAFSANFSSGGSKSEEKGYRFTFTVATNIPSPAYIA